MTRPARPSTGLKIASNTAYAGRRRRQASLLSAGGIAVLVVGLVLNLRSYDGLALVALILGSVSSWSGISLADKWLKPPREDAALDHGLARSGRAFALYHWLLPADHVLVAPWGLTVLQPAIVDGEVLISPDRWHENRPMVKRLVTIGRRSLGNPPSLAAAQVSAMRAALSAHDESLASIPIDALVVFTRPVVVVAGEDPAQPWVRAEGIGEWLAASRRKESLPPSVRRALEKVVDEMAAERMAPGKPSSGAKAG